MSDSNHAQTLAYRALCATPTETARKRRRSQAEAAAKAAAAAKPFKRPASMREIERKQQLAKIARNKAKAKARRAAR